MCGLTFETDRLIALSGLASKVHKRAQCDYLAGLWSTHLPLNLLWYLMVPMTTRSKIYVAPSWSWASVNGHIWPPSLIWPPSSQMIRRRYARMSSYETSLANPADKYGQVTSAKIELRAPLATLDWSGVHVQNTYQAGQINISVPDGSGRVCKILESSFHSPIHTLRFDYEGYAELHTAYIAIVLDHSSGFDSHGDLEHDSYGLQGLVLSRLPCSRYMRIGVAAMEIHTEQELEDIVRKMPEQDITII